NLARTRRRSPGVRPKPYEDTRRSGAAPHRSLSRKRTATTPSKPRERIPMGRFAHLRGSHVCLALLVLTLAAPHVGCRNKQYARVIKPGEDQMVGSHQAGTETFKPLVDEAVAKLLARHSHMPAQPVSYHGPEELPPPAKRICFIGVENKSAEEIGDFKEQLYQSIDSRILESGTFQPISR